MSYHGNNPRWKTVQTPNGPVRLYIVDDRSKRRRFSYESPES